MLASRMTQIAKDLQSEVDRFNLLGLLQVAKTVTASRNPAGEQQYRIDAKHIREAAEEVIKNTKFSNYPYDELQRLEESEASALLPGRIARFILAAIPPQNMMSAAASSEIEVFFQQTAKVYNEVAGFIQFANTMGVEEYAIREGSSSIEFTIPRRSFDNRLSPFASKLELFDKFFMAVSEYANGERQAPKIVYISTSDPILFLEWAGAAVTLALAIYNPILEAAERTVTVAKTIKEVLGIGGDQKLAEEIKQQLLNRTQDENTKRIEDKLDSIASSLDSARRVEVRSEIVMLSVKISHEVAQGARISIGPGHAITIDDFMDQPEKSDEIKKLIEQNRALEQRLGLLAKSLGDEIKLIEHIEVSSQDDKNVRPKD